MWLFVELGKAQLRKALSRDWFLLPVGSCDPGAAQEPCGDSDKLLVLRSGCALSLSSLEWRSWVFTWPDPGQSQLSRWDQYLDAAGNFKGIGIFMRNAVSAALVCCCGCGTGAGPSCAVIFKANQCLGHGVQ